MRLSIKIPQRGESPSEFRRALVQTLRAAAVRLQFAGKLDAELVEEIFRAFPIEAVRQ